MDLGLTFLPSGDVNLSQPPGRQQRKSGILDVLLDPVVFGVGTDLSFPLGDEDDCRQVTVEGLSVSHHQFFRQYFLMILRAAGGWGVHRLRNFWLTVNSRSDGEDEEKEGSHGDLHPLSGQSGSRGGLADTVSFLAGHPHGALRDRKSVV